MIADVARQCSDVDVGKNRRFFRKWSTIVTYMMEILQTLIKEATSSQLAMNDREINILSIVKVTIDAADRKNLTEQFLLTPPKEIEYVSITLFS